jgi:hypothetical protein
LFVVGPEGEDVVGVVRGEKDGPRCCCCGAHAARIRFAMGGSVNHSFGLRVTGLS